MEALVNNRLNEILELHRELMGFFRLSLGKGIRMGQLLSEIKESMGHGEFSGWIQQNLPFNQRTARRYMSLYHNRDKLKTDTMSDLGLTGAYRLLTTGEPAQPNNDKFQTIPTGQIVPNPFFDRRKICHARMSHLLNCLINRQGGTIPPVYWTTAVRPRGDGFYENLADEYRLAAIKAAGIARIDCVLISLTDKQMKSAAKLEPENPTWFETEVLNGGDFLNDGDS